MAIPSNAVHEFRTAGTATGGQGFVPGLGGTDYSQQDAVEHAYTDLVAPTTTTITSAARPFSTADAGNFIRVTSGTGWTAGLYYIVSVAGVTATVDRAIATAASTGGVASFGGAATLTDANFELIVAGNTAYVKNDGTYTPGGITITTANGTATAPIYVIGYNSTRGDVWSGSTLVEANRPLISNGASATTFGNYTYLIGIEYTGTATGGLRVGTGGELIGCKGSNTSTGNGMSGGSSITLTKFLLCEASSTSGAAISVSGTPAYFYGCYIHDSVTGINSTAGGITVVRNIIDTCSTAGIAVSTFGSNDICDNTIYNCGIGISASTASNTLVANNSFHTCTTGIDWSGGPVTTNVFAGNNFHNCTTNATNTEDLGYAYTTVDPGYTGAAGGDFVPGSAFAGTVFPKVYPGALTDNIYGGAGAVSPAAAGGGGGLAANPIRGFIA